MTARLSLRLRLTLACVGLVVGVTALVLVVSWGLLDRHLARTLDPVTATDVSGRLAWQYAFAVAGAGVAGFGVAWAGAGRILAPVRAIAGTARRVSDVRLDERVGLQGAGDELHELAATFDAMLDRVQGAVGAQRRFVANAGHELRTPLTVMRTEAEVALDDPGASDQDLREALRGIVEAGERAERLIDALLVLAVSTDGVPRREPVRLDEVAQRALEAGGIPGRLEPVAVTGDPVLLERLVANLAENAVRHGRDPEAALHADGGAAVLVVRNGGAPIDPGVLAHLTEPFERGRRAGGQGAGLGLSIVRAIAEAHGGTLTLGAPAAGGLQAEVRLPVRAVMPR